MLIAIKYFDQFYIQANIFHFGKSLKQGPIFRRPERVTLCEVDFGSLKNAVANRKFFSCIDMRCTLEAQKQVAVNRKFFTCIDIMYRNYFCKELLSELCSVHIGFRIPITLMPIVVNNDLHPIFNELARLLLQNRALWLTHHLSLSFSFP